MALDCFKGGSIPGNGTLIPVAGFAGSFETFAALDTALKAALVGDIAILRGLATMPVGIWQKVSTGPDTIRLISPLWLENINVSSPALAIGTDITAVRGPNPTWSASPTGLLPAQNSHLVFDCCGTYPGATWALAVRGQAKQASAANLAYFGGGWASNGKTQGCAGVVSYLSASSAWFRRHGDGELGIAAALALIISASTTRQDKTPGGSYEKFSTLGISAQASLITSTAQGASDYTWSVTDPYAADVGNNIGTIFSSGHTRQNNQDQIPMIVSDNGGSGSLDWLVQGLQMLTMEKR
jgi:hypothetical protein